jgi:hypothetical protein
MVHCGYEATAVNDTIARPWRALAVALRGPRVDGAMAPEIPLDGQRPAEFVFEGLVKQLHGESQERPRARSNAA